MSADKKPDPLPKGRVIYLGGIDLVGNKTGELWATEELVRKATSVEYLRKHGSAFKASRKRYEVGEIYEVGINLDGERLSQMEGTKIWKGMFRESDHVAAISLIEKGRLHEKAVAAAQAKAAKEGPLHAYLDRIARVVAEAPSGQQEIILQGFVSEIRKRSHRLWRARR